MKRSRKIALGEMRAYGVRGLLISDFRCSHWMAVSACGGEESMTSRPR
jgi:hypothetical protein